MGRGYVVALALLVLPALSLAATLSGTAYTQNLAVAQYAILTINTTPEQRVILTDGTYNVTVPPGTYALKASLRQSGHTYEDETVVQAVDEREYVYDLILFRSDEVAAAESIDPLGDVDFSDPVSATGSTGRSLALGALVLVALIALAALAAPRRWWARASTKESATAPPKAPGDLPDDLAQVLAALKAEGGRASQKDIRRRLPYSEAKVSMMLADLESRGLVKRIRQGRGNLIILT